VQVSLAALATGGNMFGGMALFTLYDVDLDDLTGHARECCMIAKAYGYHLKQNQFGDQYFLYPPGSDLDEPAPDFVVLKQVPYPGAPRIQIANPIPAAKLENALDQVARDEMDIKQFDARWSSYIYGPAQHSAGYSSMKEGGCGAVTMAVVMGFLQRKYGMRTVQPQGSWDDERKAQTAELKDVTDWLGDGHGRIAGMGTSQAAIKKADFAQKFPGFTLDQVSKAQALTLLQQDQFIIMNGIIEAFASMPISGHQAPDKTYNGHVVVLWCLQDGASSSYQVARMFDPGGGFRYMLASSVGKSGDQLWYPHLINDPGY
jgi:hypothetical protein